MAKRHTAGLAIAAPLALAAGALAVPGAFAAGQGNAKTKTTKPAPVVRVYAQSNGATGNEVVAFRRTADGTLVQTGEYATGGNGGLQPEPGCPGACPILDNQGSVQLAGGYLYVVNAGSNTITSFKATGSSLKRVAVTPSGGVFPSSLTVHGNVLYVLNIDSLNIAGFRIKGGKLTPIKGSNQSVTGAIQGLPRQIGFDNTGRQLIVTLLANKAAPPPAITVAKTIDVFPVGKGGAAGAARSYDSGSPGPFGFAFDKYNRPVISELHDLGASANGQVSSFSLTKAGALRALSTTPDNGSLPCWVQVSSNGYVFAVNTGAGAPSGATVSTLSLSRTGKLKLRSVTKPLSEFVRTDEVLTADGKYLYVDSPLESGAATAPGPTSHIDEYKVLPGGRLNYLGQTKSLAFPGLSGLAAG